MAGLQGQDFNGATLADWRILFRKSQDSGAGLHAQDFNDATFADLRILFRTSQDSGTNASPSSTNNATLSFFAHKVILARRSPVIKAMLLRYNEQVSERKQMTTTGRKRTRSQKDEEPDHAGVGGVGGVEVLELPVEEGEEIAAELLLRCCVYSQDLASTLNTLVEAQPADQHRKPAVKALIMAQLYRMLDRFQIDTDLWHRVINKLVHEDCGGVADVILICDVITSLPALEDTPPLKRLKSLCYQRLLSWFQHVPKTIQSILARLKPRGKGFNGVGGSSPDFLDLNFRAVKLLVEDVDNKLQVVSENDIVVLLSLWIHHQEVSLGQPCTEAERTTLSGHIRLVHLSPSYLGQLRDIAPWCTVKEPVLRTLQTCRMLMSQKVSTKEVDSVLCEIDDTKGYAESKRRSILQGDDTSPTFSWSFPADSLVGWYDKLAAMAMDQSHQCGVALAGSYLQPSAFAPAYSNGYKMSVEMCAFKSISGNPGLVLLLGMTPPLHAESTNHMLKCEAALQIKTAKPHVKNCRTWARSRVLKIADFVVSDDPRSCFLAEFRDMGGSGAMEVKLRVGSIY